MEYSIPFSGHNDKRSLRGIIFSLHFYDNFQLLKQVLPSSEQPNVSGTEVQATTVKESDVLRNSKKREKQQQRQYQRDQQNDEEEVNCRQM